jgi:hypothetical protein
VFFQTLVSAGVEVERFAFEYPHPADDRARIDTVLVDEDGRPLVAVEVKYHRSNQSGTNLPRPQLAGMLVHDVVRLAEFTPTDTARLLLYVTGFERLSATFRNAVGNWPGPIPVTVQHATDNVAGHSVRLFGITEPRN